jgi:AraC-like DNA-binding protein
VPVNSTNYRPRLALALPEYSIPYLVEADLFVRKHHNRHTHREVQVLAITGGRAAMEVGGATHDLTPGTMCVLWPGVPHRVVKKGGPMRATILDLRLSVDPPAAMVAYLEGVGGGPVYAGDAGRVTGAVSAICAAAEGGGEADAERGGGGGKETGRNAARLLAALWGLLAELQTPSAASADGSAPGPAAAAMTTDPRLARADAFFRDHLARPVGVAEVAAAVGLSRSQLTRLYLAHTAAPPAARLRRMRVDRAAQLLRDSTLSVKEIARVCGFANPNHFTRVYTDATGRTPTAERGRTRDATLRGGPGPT